MREEYMSKNHETRNQFCTESVDTWKSTSTQYMIKRYWRPLHRKCQI